MSRVAKMPVDLPQGVSATIGADAVTVKGSKGSLTLAILLLIEGFEGKGARNNVRCYRFSEEASSIASLRESKSKGPL